ncbi:gamma-glutamyltranspeptidase-domain-containing protein [Butyriboletus roseoflavus]|nr:gamma-glutamyltranspeptidase-domain-containing protein [Butyriboletus roseoflavus]
MLSLEDTSLIGSKAFSDDRLPLHTGVKARASSSWKRGFLLVSALLLLAFFRSHLVSIVRNPAYLITADHGAVAAENKRCSDIGVDILKEGGNAVDAAIGASLCVGVVNMFSSGIGGGGFMTVRIPPKTPGTTSEVFTVDYRETAPGLASKTMYVNHSVAAKYGGLAVGVPGELRGFEEAHRRWGHLPWRRLVQPSVELAAEWTVDVELARRIQMYSYLMLHSKDWRAVFAPEGKLLLQGELIQRTNYSRTLDIIANEGPGAFYKGSIADSIIRKVHDTGGILTHADLEHYAVKVERALQGTYQDRKVYTTHAPTSGPVLLHMLNLLERFNLIREGRTPLNVHRIVEAVKFGFAARTRIGDLSYYTGNTTRVSEIPTKTFADLIAANLTDDRTHPPEYYNPEFDVETDHGTSHVSVVDRDGMAVALTTTVNLVFGSQVLEPETGVVLNDEMDDFSTPGVLNWVWLAAIPLILEYADGSFYLAIGGSGGSQIFSALFQTLLNLDWGMDASQAVEYGRVHDQLYPELVGADNILPAMVLDGLRDRGHNVKVLDINRVAAVIQTVVSKDGQIYDTDWDLIASYAGLLCLASVSIYCGAFDSLPTSPRERGAPKQSVLQDDDDDDDEQDITDRLSSSDAWLFPIIGSVALFGMYMVVTYVGKEWINWLLGWYFSIAGVGSVWKSSVSLAKFVIGRDKWRMFDRHRVLLLRGPLGGLPVIPHADAGAVASGGASLHSLQACLAVDSFKTGCILLSGLFFYDIYWVFGTDVMVKVATSLDVPIKLLWPKSMTLASERGFSMLGLGDVVMPGIFIALALRYDYARKRSFGKPYFFVTLTAYVVGLITTMSVMHTLGRAQPALLYLSPACILSLVATAVVRGEVMDVWSWSDDTGARALPDVQDGGSTPQVATDGEAKAKKRKSRVSRRGNESADRT